MINTDELTDILIEEAKDLAKRINIGDDLTPEEKFERLVAQHPLPSCKQISALFEEVFWASQLTEEGRPCLPRLLYLPRQQIMGQAIHRLSEPLEVTREALRKLTPIQGELGYLTWDCESNRAEITGVQGREGGDPCDFITAALKNGALDISWACSRLIANVAAFAASTRTSVSKAASATFWWTTFGLLIPCRVEPADISDRRAAALLLGGLGALFPNIRTVIADTGHQSRKLADHLLRQDGRKLQIVKRRQRAFKITGLTWIVERSFAWLGRNRRLSKDYEYCVQSSETLIEIAATRLMLNRLAQA